MALADKLATQLRRDEGEVLHAYPDSEGYLTIGIGRLIDVRKGGGISAAESAYLFGNDVAEKTQQLDRKLPWWRELDEARQGVLLNMAFQLGVDGLVHFPKMLIACHAEMFDVAADEMLDSDWAKQTPNRAERLAKQMRSGNWQ